MKLVHRVLGKSNKGEHILLVGLDGAGKTTILYRLKQFDNPKGIPTIEFQVETVDYKGFSFTVWDHGQNTIRQLWKHYYINTSALIWTIDSSDIRRFMESKKELIQLICDEPELKKGIPLLIYANKQDLDCMSINEIVNKLFTLDGDDDNNTVSDKPKLNNITKHYEFKNEITLCEIINKRFENDDDININKELFQLIVSFIPCKSITGRIGDRDFCILPTVATAKTKSVFINNIFGGIDWIENVLTPKGKKNCSIM